VYLLSLTQIEIKLTSYGITALLGAILYLIVQRARRNSEKQKTTVGDIQKEGQILAAVPVTIFALTFLLVIVIAVLARAPWWSMLLAVPVLAWAAWWLPAGRRRVTSQASILVQGLPARVSAFVADVPGQVRWSPGTVSCVPQIQGPRGPRFQALEKLPDGREVGGVVVLTRDQPGVEVAVQLEGAGASGDYYSFAAQNGGTLVTKRTVVELPYVLALAGGMFMVKGEAPASQQRRINEVQALKTVFEADQ
jgi:hypothetical protein